MACRQDNPFFEGVKMIHFAIFLGAWLIGLLVMAKIIMPVVISIVSMPNLGAFLLIVLVVVWTCGCTVVSASGRAKQ
jgi:hypothetical protein